VSPSDLDPARPLSAVSLRDRFERERGSVRLSGIQALVRLPLDQIRRDRAQGLRTAGLISGYRGSPLGGLDQQLWRNQELLKSHGVEFVPGLNEALAANAIWGSQQLNLFPGARYQGVFGLWYGKAPGLDQASDAIRHASAAGSSPHGGALLIVGDDHASKSSTYPSQSEYALMDMEIPVLHPAGAAEVLPYGLLGIALSRYAGCWSSLIALTDAMDSTETVHVAPELPAIALPREPGLAAGGLGIRLHDTPEAQEARVREQRLPAVLAFARANPLNTIALDSPRARLGLVATGKAYLELREALRLLGIDEALAARLGLRVLKVGMPWPLEPEGVTRFARGLEEILVVEEKRPLLESQLRDILYAQPAGERPRVLGKRDERGAELLSSVYELDAARIARALCARLAGGCPTERGRHYLAQVEARERALGAAAFPSRSPFYCSGCPHNTSTVVPAGSRAMVGIGCHYIVQWQDRSSYLFSQMGGEGVAWLGQAPFTEEPHVFANLGDGTYQHSGILAIRAAVAAGVSMTYKILVNGAVAMTGGQPVEGGLEIAQLTRQLAAEGVARIALVSDRPERFARAELAPGTELAHRSQLGAVQEQLRQVRGVSALIYDQACAAEARRKRKRGELVDPPRRVLINERVCEGCGDCVSASNCLSVEPHETPYGSKRRINQSSCNKDESCLKGLCPSFAVVKGGRLRRGELGGLAARFAELPEPLRPAPGGESCEILLTGIGGTGVTTVAALLAMAAHLEGRPAATLDMTGLAQKGGGVRSHVRLGQRGGPPIWGPRVSPASADVLLAFDPLVAVNRGAAEMLCPERTHALVNEHAVPTSEGVLDARRHFSTPALLEAIGRASRTLDSVDATALSEKLLGDSVASNVFLLGFAYQKGALPLSAAALDRAIELNQVSVAENRQAFALGRLVAHDPQLAKDLLEPSPEARPPASLDELVAQRGAELERYQDAAYAQRYRALLERVRRAERAVAPGGSQGVSEAVARSYHKLLAYKDEYEVARLYTSGEFERQLREQFEGDFEVEYQLAPPLWSARDPQTGRPRKRGYGPWVVPLFRLLVRLRFLRGTALDPFGYLAERRAERAWITRYELTVETLLAGLRADNLELAREIAALPEGIRGFDLVKQRNAAQVEERELALLARFRGAAAGDCSGS
jgi:indolepyruvate ferredoxin oxidoreductase